MNNYQKALIEEHSQLVVRICNLNNNIYNKESVNDTQVEFGNKMVQLVSMQNYCYALEARLMNAGVTYEHDQYFERVAEIKNVEAVEIVPTTEGKPGSDFDKDGEESNSPSND